MLYRVHRVKLLLACVLFAPLASLPMQAFAQEPVAPPVVAVPTLSLEGAWIGAGTVTNAPGQELFTAIRISRGADKKMGVRVMAPQLLALDAPARDVQVIGATVAFSVDMQGASIRFDGALDATGASIVGTWGFIGPSGKVEGGTQPWSVKRTYDLRDLPTYEAWKGDLAVGAQRMVFAIAIGKSDLGLVGAMDIPSQGARGIPVSVEETPKGYRLTLASGAKAIYEVERTADNSLVGTMTQGTFSAPVSLTFDPAYRILGRGRLQDPQPPFPYTEREVSIPHPFGHTLAGTLTIPSDATLARNGKFPALLLVSGSGAQNRDEEVLGHRPFAVIADALARKGVAVLRYDDRGTGRSKGSFAGSTTLDFATDADAASEFLKKLAEIDADRIGIAGHSEGGMIAPLVSMWQNEGLGASDPESAAVSFLVLLAAPAQRGAEVLVWQTGELMRAEGVSEEAIAAVLVAHTAVMNAVIDKQPAAELLAAMETLIRTQVDATGTVMDEASLQSTLNAAIAGMQDKWMTTFITYDPIRAIQRCRVPVYAIAGDKDLQVDGRANLALISRATGDAGLRAQVRLYNGLNHLFQPCKTGSVSEYAEIETTFDATALNDMVAWVVKTCIELKPRAARTPPPLPAEGDAAVSESAKSAPTGQLQATPLEVKPKAP